MDSTDTISSDAGHGIDPSEIELQEAILDLQDQAFEYDGFNPRQ
jgi:hypothetical protein